MAIGGSGSSVAIDRRIGDSFFQPELTMKLTRMPIPQGPRRRTSRSRSNALKGVVVGALWCLGGLSAHAASDDRAARFYEDALSRYERQDIDGAIIQLKNALQIDKRMLPVQVLLGKALLAKGEAVAAEVALTEALGLGVNRAEVVVPLAQAIVAQGKQPLILEQPRFAVAGLPAGVQVQLLLLRSSAASDLGDSREALKSIDQARAIDASTAEVWLAEVPVRIRTRQFREATAAVDKALVIAPNSAEALYQKGSLAHVLGDLRAALAAYDRTLQRDARHVEARVARAGLYIDLGQPADAAKDVAEVQRLAPGEPRAAYLKALLAERAGNAAAARSGLREVTELVDPVPIEFIRYRPQLLMLNGLAHFGLNELGKAKPYLDAFQKVNGSSPVSKLLARVYLAEPNAPRAIELLETYLRAQPGDAQALTLLAAAHMAQGRHAKATALMQEALRGRDAAEFHTALGLSLLGGGRPGNAVVELESAFAKDPAQTQAGVALVGLYLRNQQSAKALAICKILLQRQPANPGLLNLLGMASAQGGDAAGARAAFEQAIKLDDSLFQARINLARLDIAAKAFDAAAARLAAVLKADEKNVEAMLEMATLSERRGQGADAQRWLEKAVDTGGPRELRPGFALVDLHLRNGRAVPALEAAKRLASNAPEDLAVLLALARAQLVNADATGARNTLTTATRVAGFEAPVQVEIASLQLAAGDPAGASYSLDKALSDRADFLPALALMTDVELRRGETGKAEQRARQIILKHPKRAIGYSLLGDVSLARGQAAAALEAYRRAHQVEPSTDTMLRLLRTMFTQDATKPALQLAEQWIKAHPQDLAVRKALAGGYARTGNFSAARAAYDSLLKLAPQDGEALNNMANVLLRSKDPAALQYAERALAKNPTSPIVIDTLGWVVFQNGQSDRALQLLRDARLRDPGNPEIRFHLAAVLAHTGRKTEARDELEAALKGGRGFESAAEAEALLGTLK